LLAAEGRGGGWPTGPRARRRAGRRSQGRASWWPLVAERHGSPGRSRATALYGSRSSPPSPSRVSSSG